MGLYELPVVKRAKAIVTSSAAKTTNFALEVIFRNRYRYKNTFETTSGRIVLADLAKFARLNDNLFRDDSRKVDYLLGQRSVLLRILGILNMSNEDIYQLTRREGDDLEE